MSLDDSPPWHPIQRRFFVEELFRLRRSDEQRRYLASQRAAQIDPNPHQIDAVVFALSRLADGGCILADEVGLGKTIEAGLVISQLLAEGKRRVLLVTPKPLLGQWKQELYTLFGLEAREGAAAPGAFAGDGVFLAGRELVGSEKGAALLSQNEPFDLCVIDEAHEIFAGIYKRFDRWGNYNADSDQAATAGRLRTLLQLNATPVLLLTATPIQNSLTELWGLVQYVDPGSTLLGNLHTFREVFCEGNDRQLIPGQEHELRQRLNTVVKRTLRRQAQEFIDRPFVGRHAEIFEYAMSPEERRLYDDVSRYLLEPDLCAFRGTQRRLLLIGFHKRMASSMRALAASLDVIVARLRGEDRSDEMRLDLEDEDLNFEDLDDAPPPLPAAVQAELSRVESYAARARALPHDSKAAALLKAVEATDKVVIFTESLVTQEYLREILMNTGGLSDDDITLFRGSNDSERAAQALARWQAEVNSENPPSRDIAVRLALVHEFRTRSRIFISSEAGAKGLNLQFCSTLVNYDLPWNPQKIEQRIGRCHRYGQTRDVTVINFLDKDNEAQRLTLQILTDKLDLFGTVLGASDQVLQSPDLVGNIGADFDARLRKIYQDARSIGEIEAELRQFRDEVDTRRKEFEAAHSRTAAVIQSRFDDSVRPVFGRIKDELQTGLVELDNDLNRVVCGYLQSRPGSEPVDIATAQLHLNHPLILAAADEARKATTGRQFSVRIQTDGSIGTGLQGRKGRLLLGKVSLGGFEPTERVVPAILLEGDDDALDSSLATQLLQQPMVDLATMPVVSVSTQDVTEALELLLFHDHSDLTRGEEGRFDKAMAQIERYLEDQLLLLRRQRTSLLSRVSDAQDEFLKSVGAEQRSKVEKRQKALETELEQVDARIAQLESRDDELYQALREQAFERRYSVPSLQPLLEAELEIR